MGGEPKCGSKALWGVLTVIFSLVGLIMAIVPFIVGACPECCGADCWGHSCHGNCDDVCGTYTNSQGEICLEPTGGAVTPGAWWALLIIGIIFLILGCVFSRGACNCCCFKGDGAPAADEMDASSRPRRTPRSRPEQIDRPPPKAYHPCRRQSSPQGPDPPLTDGCNQNNPNAPPSQASRR